MKILSFVIQIASCERFFSAFGNYITKQRNSLCSSKVHYLTQVKRHVNLLDEKDKIDKNPKRKKKKIIIDPTEREKSNHAMMTLLKRRRLLYM